jgi:lipopolysaccharide transport system permease protein
MLDAAGHTGPMVVDAYGPGRPDAAARLSRLAAVPLSFWRHRFLIAQFTGRELTARYRGSVLGVAWSLVTPLLMLATYTFLFGVVFRGRWSSDGQEGRFTFALILFVGLAVYGLVAECLSRAPSLIVANAHLVKRVIFPVEVLGWSLMGGALVQLALSLLVWCGAARLAGFGLHWTLLLLPIVLLPLVLCMLSVIWLLAGLGVYLRDMNQVIGVVTSLLMFLSPVFYRADAVPAPLQALVRWNPLTYFIETIRNLVVWHRVPALEPLVAAFAIGAVAATTGLLCFRRARRGFADVL